MRAVVQRVTEARVVVDGRTVGEIGTGLVVLLGVTHDDTGDTAQRLAAKIHGLRVLRGETSVADTGAGVLVISQFTLYGDARKGRRPTWTAAAPGAVAEPLYTAFCDHLRSLGAAVEQGVFGADMAVSLTNDGPTTLLLEM
jgi:D-tyrosyl-tRNA(Tyr) deacylase